MIIIDVFLFSVALFSLTAYHKNRTLASDDVVKIEF